MFDWLSMRWQIFWYNFTWDKYASYLNGPLAKASFAMPLIGYAIIFNDYVTENLTFSNLTNEVRTTFFLQPEYRLRILFFAFMLVASANVSYRLMRPFAMKTGENLKEFSEYYLTQVPAHVFLRLHQEIRHSDFDPFTQDGKYYDDDWELFWREAVWPSSGKNYLDKDADLATLPDYDRVDYEDAKRRHRSLLLSILRETYFRKTRKRRAQLILCIGLATIGYVLFLIPSLDLTLRVLELTFWQA